MRLRNVTGSEELIAKSRYVCSNPEVCRGKWNSFFQNENPIHIEIGMGKGQFLVHMAELHPEINYIGIERYSSVIYRAIQKIEPICMAEENAIRNLVFVCMDAADVVKIFGRGEVQRIYLNFSDPWPKDRHAKRRLPSRSFLKLYDEVLHTTGHIEFKTDNEQLFRFALEEIAPAGWKEDRITYDLHHDPDWMRDNVMTEYEEKFSLLGNPIYKYIISR